MTVRETMSFEDAVRTARHPVNCAYRSGKQALGKKHGKSIHCTNPQRLTGSIDLDPAIKREPRHADAPRWDYGIGYKPPGNKQQWVIWIEFHPATTGEVSAVLKKLRWLKDWLNEEARQLKKITERAEKDIRFIWLAGGAGIKIPKNSPQARQLSQNGIRLKKNLELS